ncbi:GNAT family N-acetyltransferase [Lysobacter sp. 5GHs7-4]|uniref:GNAT family N-acetyltransferase n=1 Tax=Lysobacter sp. 5GHs7-4 TaxID=2904253 RepID=UPI001E2F588B|nr:GNAT family N-acetyltransferase [Lysobacter sp. 5GHs7-4]UHQ22493.1 GNAT family N-acetyltransferase [Lysobacter sp. 5GHs7-4]
MSLSEKSAAIAAALQAQSEFPLLRGERIALRGPRDEDADALFALFSEPQVMRYWSRPAMRGRDEARALIDNIREGQQQRTMFNWVIADAADVAVGSCTLFQFDAVHRRAELGYALHPSQWGRGIAREAASLTLDWAFDGLGLHRVDAGIDPDNDASRALLHRLGFVTEGRQRESFFVGDRVTDSELLGLLAADWRARR